jgi:hypothetical protein
MNSSAPLLLRGGAAPSRQIARWAASALALLLLLLSGCHSRAALDRRQLFEGFRYLGRSTALDSTAATPQLGPEPSQPETEVAYFYEPQGSADFDRLGSQTLVERLRRQGFQITSAPGVNGGDFNQADSRTQMFVVGFQRGECSGSVTGTENTARRQRYILKLHTGC